MGANCMTIRALLVWIFFFIETFVAVYEHIISISIVVALTRAAGPGSGCSCSPHQVQLARLTTS